MNLNKAIKDSVVLPDGWSVECRAGGGFTDLQPIRFTAVRSEDDLRVSSTSSDVLARVVSDIEATGAQRAITGD